MQFVSVVARKWKTRTFHRITQCKLKLSGHAKRTPNKLPKPHATTLNVVGFYMLRPFAHPVACCMLLCVVGSCCEKFETGETFSYNNSEHCWAYNVEIVSSVWV